MLRQHRRAGNDFIQMSRPIRARGFATAIVMSGVLFLAGCGSPASAGNGTVNGTTGAGSGLNTPQAGDSNASGNTNKIFPVNRSTPQIMSVDMVSQKDGWATGYVGGQSALWRSTYGGVVWERVTLPFDAMPKSSSTQESGFVMSALGADQLFVAKVTSTGIDTYGTTDGGKTWTALANVQTKDKMVSMFHFINSSDGWMVTDNGVAAHQAVYHLFRTTDGGQTWHLISQTGASSSPNVGSVPGYGDAVFSFDQAGTGWMTGQGEINGKGFLFRSSDGGASWNAVSVPVPKEDAGDLVTTSKPAYGDKGVSIVIQYQGKHRNSTSVLRINNQGAVLDVTPPLQTAKPLVTDFVNSADGWATDAPWAPQNPQLYRTTNGGQSWSPLLTNKQMFAANPHIEFVSPMAGFAFKTNPNTGHSMLWRTTNGGKTWGRMIMKIYTNGGAVSPIQSPPPPSAPQFTPQQIDFVSGQVGYLSGDYGNGQTSVGRVYKTTDGGKRWTEIYHGGTGIFSVDARGDDVWIDVTQAADADSQGPNGVLMYSGDGGKSFVRLGSRAYHSIDFVSQHVGWAVSASDDFRSKLVYTNDGGRSWQISSASSTSGAGSSVSSSGAVGSPTAVSFADPLNGMLLQTGEPGAGQQPKSLLQTTSGGKRWSLISSARMGGHTGSHQLSSGGYADGIDVVPGNPSEAFIWESRGPLLLTSDGGHAWVVSKLTKPDLLEASCVSMLNPNDGYVLVHDMQPNEHGFVLEKTTDGLQSWTQVYKWPTGG